jgi:hypothetical protein
LQRFYAEEKTKARELYSRELDMVTYQFTELPSAGEVFAATGDITGMKAAPREQAVQPGLENLFSTISADNLLTQLPRFD